MKHRFLFVIIVLMVVTGITVSLYILKEGNSVSIPEHTTEINRHLLRLQETWDEVKTHNGDWIDKDKTYDYVIIDTDGIKNSV